MSANAPQPTPPSPESLAFRRVMREWVTGVTIVTVSHDGAAHGMTCNSFTSVSVEPPTVLICVRRDSRTHDLVARAGRFAVSILDAAGLPWSDRFAGIHGGDAQNRFDDVPHRLAPSGAPWIDGALGYFDCHIVAEHSGKTHTIFLAQVDTAEPGADGREPLVRFHSAYTQLR